ncbi:MAG: hypothetical protein AAFW73_19450 [Bacteroidota bacterium]
MKINFTTALGSFLLLFAFHQPLRATAIDDLNQVIHFADQAKDNAKNAREATKDLAVLYFQLNDDHIDGYIQVIFDEMDELEEAADEIIFFINRAAGQNANIDPSDIQDWAGELEILEDQVRQEATTLQSQIDSGQRREARATYRRLLTLLRQQINLAKEIKAEAIELQAVAQTYDVRIELIYYGQVYNGNTTLGGFYGINQYRNETFYPGFNGDNVFNNLPGGTYTFGSFDGYFDGTGTTQVTLDPSLIGPDGFIVVQLSYWSE